jgi:hypothetical protein
LTPSCANAATPPVAGRGGLRHPWLMTTLPRTSALLSADNAGVIVC